MRRLLLLSCIILGFVRCEDPPPPVPTGIASVIIADGFELPVFVTSFPEDSSRLLVGEQNSALIWLVEIAKGESTLFLDLSDKVESGGFEQGLYSLAFHPDYEQNGYVFIGYADKQDATTVERYTVSESGDEAEPESGTVIVSIDQPDITHNAGTVAFGPLDGYLYLSVGDGGFRLPPRTTASDLSSPLGKILRIDVDGEAPFEIPPSNPFVGVEDADERIWSYGFRNPWRFSFDPKTGDLFIGDVGQFAREEIDYQSGESAGGENYGWPIAEGFDCVGGGGDCGENHEGFTPPVYAYGDIIPGSAVIAGHVYRGTALPDMEGRYFFADFVTSDVWSFLVDDIDDDPETPLDVEEHTHDLEPDPGFNGIAAFGVDADGELYIVDRGRGRILKIVPATNP